MTVQAGGRGRGDIFGRRFLRLYGKVNYFHPMSDAQTLILRAELGGVSAGGRNGIPDDFLFSRRR